MAAEGAFHYHWDAWLSGSRATALRPAVPSADILKLWSRKFESHSAGIPLFLQHLVSRRTGAAGAYGAGTGAPRRRRAGACPGGPLRTGRTRLRWRFANARHPAARFAPDRFSDGGYRGLCRRPDRRGGARAARPVPRFAGPLRDAAAGDRRRGRHLRQRALGRSEPGEVRGQRAGQPPEGGTLRHKGWRAAKVDLPALAGRQDAAVIAPAEIEIE